MSKSLDELKLQLAEAHKHKALQPSLYERAEKLKEFNGLERDVAIIREIESDAFIAGFDAAVAELTSRGLQEFDEQKFKQDIDAYLVTCPADEFEKMKRDPTRLIFVAGKLLKDCAHAQLTARDSYYSVQIQLERELNADLRAELVAAEDMNEKHVAEIEKLRQDLAEAKAEQFRQCPECGTEMANLGTVDEKLLSELDRLRAEIERIKSENAELLEENTNYLIDRRD